MKYLIKDNKKRLLFKKYELRRVCLKLLVNNTRLEKCEKLFIKNYLVNKQPKNCSKVRYKNICVFTGRTRGVLSKFKQSRLSLKRNILQGFFPGYKKF